MRPHVLELLVSPMGGVAFFAEFWERRPLHIRRGEEGYFKAILTRETVERVLKRQPLRASECLLVRDGSDVPRSRYCEGPAEENSLVRKRIMLQEFQRGATIVLNGLHRRLKSLSRLCKQLEADLTQPCQANMYFTPAGSKGFAPHYDTHDVFVLQISGTKRWRVSPAAIPLPDETMGFDRNRVGRTRALLDCRLAPGDTLYIPRGFVHQARAARDASLHVTLGVLSYTWADLLCESVRLASLHNVRYRKGLQPGFGHWPSRRSELASGYGALISKLAKYSNVRAAVDGLMRRLIARAAAPRANGGAKAKSLKHLRMETVLRRAPVGACFVRRQGKKVCLLYEGKQISFPAFAEKALRYLATQERITVAAIPGRLHPRSRQLLARRLLEEGFLELARPSQGRTS